jgi:uncharacterized membrane protein AbrB (regulator of aidB expression)
MFGGTCIYLAVIQVPVPEWLLNLTWVTVAFWMGAKVEHAVLSKRA